MTAIKTYYNECGHLASWKIWSFIWDDLSKSKYYS
ncbi:hypothetical protein J2X17_003430 [Flavobacterium aquidurense]|nr:hypothetical protein [Flavobacterium aquidurense]